MGTSATKAKGKYNKQNYDTVTIRTYKGGNDAINELARMHNKSKSDYVRDLIRADARALNRYDLEDRVLHGGNARILPPPPHAVREPHRG